MSRSLVEQLPSIVAGGKRQAAQMLEQLEGPNRVSLQTRELVIPAKDTQAADLFHAQKDTEIDERPNRLVYGDNLLAMAALLAGDEDNPSLRGQVDLIYIDPPFDSKADYRSKIVLPGATLDQKPTVLEQFAYSDTWAEGTASFLAMLTPRLVLMRDLLSNTGSIFVHPDWHVGHYVKILLDDIFGKEYFRNEIVWHYYNKLQGNVGRFASNHDILFVYKKLENPTYNVIRSCATSRSASRRGLGTRKPSRSSRPGTKTAISSITKTRTACSTMSGVCPTSCPPTRPRTSELSDPEARDAPGAESSNLPPLRAILSPTSSSVPGRRPRLRSGWDVGGLPPTSASQPR